MEDLKIKLEVHVELKVCHVIFVYMDPKSMHKSPISRRVTSKPAINMSLEETKLELEVHVPTAAPAKMAAPAQLRIPSMGC